MKVPDGSCESAIGAKQLTFMYGDVADRRYVRLAGNFAGIQNYRPKLHCDGRTFEIMQMYSEELPIEIDLTE